MRAEESVWGRAPPLLTSSATVDKRPGRVDEYCFLCGGSWRAGVGFYQAATNLLMFKHTFVSLSSLAVGPPSSLRGGRGPSSKRRVSSDTQGSLLFGSTFLLMDKKAPSFQYGIVWQGVIDGVLG